MVNLFSATKTVTTDVKEDQIVLIREVFREDPLTVSDHYVDFEPFPNYVLLAELIFPIPQFAGRVLVRLTFEVENLFDSSIISLPSPATSLSNVDRGLRFQRSDEDGTNTIILAENPGLKFNVAHTSGSDESRRHSLVIEEDTTVTALVRRYSITIINQGGIQSSPAGGNSGPFGQHVEKRKLTVRAELR